MITNKCNLEGKITAKQPMTGKLNNPIEIIYPELENITITPTKQEQNFSSFKGFGNIKVEGYKLKLQNKIVTKNGKYTADEGFDGLGEVDVVTNGVDINLYFSQKPTSGSAKNWIKKFPYTDLSSLGTLANTFENLSFLEEIEGLNTTGITKMTDVFAYCRELKKVPLFDTSAVTNMYDMFRQCVTLEEVPSFDTSNVENMEAMFFGCAKLKEVPAFNTSKVTNMYNMCNGCDRLVTVPQLDTTNVTNMFSMFYNCYLLSDESLNNILAMCISATQISSKKLSNIGLSTQQIAKCKTLSNYQAFLDAGWTA